MQIVLRAEAARWVVELLADILTDARLRPKLRAVNSPQAA